MSFAAIRNLEWYWKFANDDNNSNIQGPFTIDDLKDQIEDEEFSLEEVLLCSNQIGSAFEATSVDWKTIDNFSSAKEYLTAKSDQDEEVPQDLNSFLQQVESTNSKTSSTTNGENQDVTFDQNRGKYVYFDAAQNIQFEFDNQIQQWIPIQDSSTDNIHNSEQNPDTINNKKRKEHPTSQETDAEADLLRIHQLEQKLEEEEQKLEQQHIAEYLASKKANKRKKQKKNPTTERKPKNTSVYATGIPLDATFDEIAEFFKIGGIIKEDVETNKKKIRMYRDPQTNQFTGNILVTFVREESVDQAIRLLDGMAFRLIADPKQKSLESIVHVEAATFDPSKKAENPQPYISRPKANKKMKQLEHKKLGWGLVDDNDPIQEAPRIVILKYMFLPKDVVSDPNFGTELKEEVKEECEKFGPVERVKVLEDHPDGIIEVKFRFGSAAESCIATMNGRFFDGRKIEAFMWDYKTNYHEEAEINREEDEKARLEAYSKSLEEEAKN